MDKVLRTKLELTGEGSYKEKLKQINGALSGIRSEEALLNAQYGKNDNSVVALSARYDVFQRKSEAMHTRLKETRKEWERVAKAEGENSDAAVKLQKEYNHMSAQVINVDKALDEMSKGMDQAKGKMGAVRTALKDWGVDATRVGQIMEGMGKKIALAMTGAVTAVAGVSIKAFQDFEDSLASLYTIADSGEVSINEMSESLLKYSDATGIAATELSAAAYQAISAGQSTKEAASFVALAAKTAKGGMTDTTTVVDGVTSAMNAWKIEASDAESVMDKLITTQNLGKTSVGQLAASIGQLTGVAPQLNMSLEETLAATAALTKNGVSTSAAMNGLKAVMAGIMKPTAEAQKEAERLGLEFNSAAMQAQGFTGFLKSVMAATDGNADSLAKLFGSVEGLSQIMLLGGNAAQDYADIMEAMSNSAGVMEETFSARTASRTEQMNMALNKLKNNAIELGETFAPYIDMAADALSRLSDMIAGLSQEQMMGILQTALWVAGMGGVISVGGKILQNLSAVKKAFTALSGVMSRGALGGVLVAVAAVTAGVIALKKHLDSVNPVNKLKTAFETVDVDQTAIDSAITAAEQVEHDMKLLVKAQISLSQESQSLSDWAVQWLTDGKLEVDAEKAELQKKADEVIAPITESIEAAFNEKKAALDASLAGGLIDSETYSSQLEAYKNSADAMTASITAEKDAFVAYSLELAEAGVKPTQDQLDKLNELSAAITRTGNEILEATNTAQQVARASYTMVTSGNGTTDDVGVATAYAKSKRDIALQNAQDTRDMTISQFAGDSVAIQAARDEYAKIERGIMAEYTAMMNDITDGIALKYPEQAARIQEIAKNQSVVEMIAQALSFVGSDSDLTQAAINQVYEQVYGVQDGVETILSNRAYELYDEMDRLRKLNAELVNAGGYDDIITDATAAFDIADGLDPSSMDDMLSAFNTFIDLSDDGRTAAEDYVLTAKDLEKSVNAVEEAVNTAKSFSAVAFDDTKAHIETASAEIDLVLSNFATGVADYGEDSIIQWTGRVNGTKRTLINTYADIVNKVNGYMTELESYMERTSYLLEYGYVGAGEGGGSRMTVNNTINYTGAVTRRDANKLQKELVKSSLKTNYGRGQ